MIYIEGYKIVRGYDNYYINSSGEIYSLYSKKHLKKHINTSGYYFVNLHNNKKQNCLMVHKLVIEAFTNHVCNRFLVIDHINNNKLDNRLSNLQIITNRHNSTKDKKSKSGHHCIYKNGNKWILRLRENGIKKTLGTFKNIEDAIIERDKYFNCEKIRLIKD